MVIGFIIETNDSCFRLMILVLLCHAKVYTVIMQKMFANFCFSIAVFLIGHIGSGVVKINFAINQLQMLSRI